MWTKYFALTMIFKGEYCFISKLITYRTGAVVAAGFINAQKITGVPYKDNKFVVVGAGSAGIGVADVLIELFVDKGMSKEDAKKKIFMVDSKVNNEYFIEIDKYRD
jgi:hypothetical protein